MNSKTIIRIFLFNVFMIICLSLVIYGQKNTQSNNKTKDTVNIIWVHEFQESLGYPDTLSMIGTLYLADNLEDVCIDLCARRNFNINFKIKKHQTSTTEKTDQQNTADNVYRKDESERNLNELECEITTSYVREKNSYRISSKIKKGNEEKKIPRFELPYKLNNMKIEFTGDLLKFHAESIADSLYKLYGLTYSRSKYYVYTQKIKKEDLPESLSDFNELPRDILDGLIEITRGKVQKANSDTTTILDVDLKLSGSKIIINVTIENSSGVIARYRDYFNRDDYMESINNIIQELAKQI